MATDNKKGEAAREALAKQAPGILDALLPKKLGDLLAGVTEKDLRGPEPMVETLKATTGTPGAWLFSSGATHYAQYPAGFPGETTVLFRHTYAIKYSGMSFRGDR